MSIRSYQIISRLRAKFGLKRPVKSISSIEYSKRFSAKWHQVYESSPANHPPIERYGSLIVDLENMVDSHFPEMGVLEIPNASIYGKHGWIYSKEGHLLADHSWFRGHVEDMQNLPSELPSGQRLSGVGLSLASDFSVSSYGHFVIDCLGRLDLFFKAGFTFNDVDHIFCPFPTPGNAKVLFDALGIPKEKHVPTDFDETHHIENLIAPTFPGLRRNYPKWVPEFFQKTFLSSCSKPSRRLYISRSGYQRNIQNESETLEVLLQFGFEIYNPENHPNSHLDFSESNIVVGVSGSGLTGLAFCQPRTKVLELVPTDHVFPYYLTLSCSADLDYHYLPCQSTNAIRKQASGPGNSNVIIDTMDLRRALQQLIE